MSEKVMDAFIVSPTRDDKSRWTRVGAVFQNRDDSLTVLFDTVSGQGKLVLRKVEEASPSSPKGFGAPTAPLQAWGG